MIGRRLLCIFGYHGKVYRAMPQPPRGWQVTCPFCRKTK